MTNAYNINIEKIIENISTQIKHEKITSKKDLPDMLKLLNDKKLKTVKIIKYLNVHLIG